MAIQPVKLIKLTTSPFPTVPFPNCEHPDLDEITGYLADGLQPPRSLHLAQTICDRADELNRIIDAYRFSLDVEISNVTTVTDLPF